MAILVLLMKGSYDVAYKRNGTLLHLFSSPKN